MAKTLFVCKKMNWGMIISGTGAWLSTKWTVYDDHTMIREDRYDACYFDEDKDVELRRSNRILDVKLFDMLKLWVDDVFPSATVSEGYDGTGWEITSFNENCNIIHSVSGYIYDNPIYDLMLSILY